MAAPRRAWHWFSLSSLVFGVAACSSSCRGCGKSEIPAVASDPAAGEPRVELVNPGREPRAKLEVERWTGFSYRSELESESSWGIQGHVPATLPVAMAVVRSQVTRGMGDPIVRQRGSSELRLLEEHATLEKLAVRSNVFPPQTVAHYNAGLAVFAGTTARSLIAEDGEVVEMKTELVGGKKPTPEIAAILDATWDAQRRFPFRLPAEAVGPGASWRFSESLQFRDVRGLQLAEMHLLALDEQTARIRIRIRHQAPRQEVPHPLNPKDTAMLENYRGDADGELTIDRATAVQLDSRMATTATLRMSGYVDGGKQTVTFVAATRILSHAEILKADAGTADSGAHAEAGSAPTDR